MSQAGTFEAGNPAIPDVQTLTGNVGGAVSPDGTGNINVVGDLDFTVVTGNPGTNTLTITLLNTDIFSVQTVDDTPTPLATLALSDSSAVSIICDVIGAQDNYAQVCSGVIQASARRNGGGALLVEVPSLWNTSDNFATADFDIIVSGNNIILQVTGELATTINWLATIRYNVIDI